MHKEEDAPVTLAKDIKRFGLTVRDLEIASGRTPPTLYQWHKKDPKLIQCILKAALIDKIEEQCSFTLDLIEAIKA